MKIHIIYSSMTGCTKKVAETLYNGLDSSLEKEITDVKHKPNVKNDDILAIGYWVNQEGPNEMAAEFLKSISGKKIFLFATLAYYIDSDHAYKSIKNGVKIAEEAGNEVIGYFICNGATAPAVIERFKKIAEKDPNNKHAYTPEKAIRYEIMANHPTLAECTLASERFNERILLFQKLSELKNKK